MSENFDGTITSIDLPCPILIEVSFSVAVEENLSEVVELEYAYPSGREVRLEITLFEKFIGDKELSDVPVIKYSSERFAPALCNSIRLRTPNYYRTLESKYSGLGDPLEGCGVPHLFSPKTKMTVTSEDGPSLVFDASGARKTDSCSKAFMYCTSLYSSGQILSQDTAREMLDEEYTYGSVFPSSSRLATHILKAFAGTIGRSMLNGEEPAEEGSLAHAYAWIVHGPVNYSNNRDFIPPRIESLFTKPDEDIYRVQEEYRYWVGFSDTPAQSDEATIRLPIPPEMSTAIELKPC